MSTGDAAGGGAVVERVFEAKTEAIPEVIGFIAEQAEAWGLHPQRLMQLELAVEEAVVNICLYAYEVPPGELLVRVDSGEERFLVDSLTRACRSTRSPSRSPTCGRRPASGRSAGSASSSSAG